MGFFGLLIALAVGFWLVSILYQTIKPGSAGVYEVNTAENVLVGAGNQLFKA